MNFEACCALRLRKSREVHIMIPYGRQSIDEDDIAAVVQVLRSDWLTQGPAVANFEAGIAERVDAKYAVSFANGTAALHAAMAAGGIGPKHHVLTSPLSFVASANCARYVGASVGFVDIDPSTWNLDPRAVTQCDALVAVHYAGLPCELEGLKVRPRVIIEDACHALGARTAAGPVGNCAYSDMTVFSFHPVKSITCGEGGVVTTNSLELAESMRRFRSHGTVAKPQYGGWYYEVETLGFNYRLTDLQAALGLSQLDKLATFVAMRNALADRYRRVFRDLSNGGIVLPPAAAPGSKHAYHLFPILVSQRRNVYDALRARDIGTQVHYVPIYRHPLYADSFVNPLDFPFTEHVYSGILSLPLHPTLTRGEQDIVIETVIEAVQSNSNRAEVDTSAINNAA